MRALPENCRGCVYFRSQESRCHRHAPSPGEATPGQLLFSYWTEVSPDDRCGAGADVRSPGDAAVVSCIDCVHWWQPGGVGLQPRFLNGKTREWWQQSGFCTANAPIPSSEPRRKAAWVVKHASEGCGDGLHVADANEVDGDFAADEVA
jgi:hypothetical protein